MTRAPRASAPPQDDRAARSATVALAAPLVVAASVAAWLGARGVAVGALVALGGVAAALALRARGWRAAALHVGAALTLLGVALAVRATGGVSGPLAASLACVPLGVIALWPARAPIWIAATLATIAGLAFLDARAAEAASSAALLACIVAASSVAVLVPRRALARRLDDARARARGAEGVAARHALDAEAERTADVERRSFVATISHELRTPLGGLLGMIAVLEGSKLDAVQREIVGAMSSSGRSLRALVDDLLDLERLERGRVELALRPTDVELVIGDVLDLFSANAYANGVELVGHISPTVPAAVMLDEQRVRQIVSNLVGNAVKFTERGEIVVRAEYDADAARLELSVRDTGPGMSSAKIPLLFSPFGQDSTVTRRFGGSGLGLSISRQLAEQMGGSIGVESARGVGSTFRVSLPAAPVEAIEGRTSVEVPNVLMVDAAAPVRDAWAAACVRHGVPTTVAATLAEAIEALPGVIPFGAVLVDASLFRDTADARRWLASHPALARLPVVLAIRASQADETQSFREITGVLAVTLRPLRWRRVAAALDQAAHESRMPSAQPPLGRSRLTVLVVDDDRVNRLAAQLVLERAGHTVHEASDGSAAIAAALTQRYDLVLLDLHMPDMLGTEVAERLRALPRDGAPLVIAALTAAAFDEDRAACERAGMNAFLTKPLDVAALHAVTEACERGIARARRGAVSSRPSGVLDLERLGEIEGVFDDGTERAQLILDFVESTRVLLAEIRETHAGLDREGLRRATHRLSGSAAVLGAIALADAARVIEVALHAGANLESLGPEVARLDAAADAVLSVLDARARDHASRERGARDTTSR